MSSPGETLQKRDVPATDHYLFYLRLISTALVVAALYFGRPVLLPLAVAVLLSFALSPLVSTLRRIHLGRASSVILAALLAIGIMGVAGAFMGTQVARLADALPSYQSNVMEKIRSIRGMTVEDGLIQRTSYVLKNLRDQISGPPAVAPPPRISARTLAQGPVPVEIRPADPAPLELVVGIVGNVLGPLASMVIILIFVVFILLQKEDLRDRFISLAGSRDIQRAKSLLDEGADRLSRFLLIQTAINVSFGTFVGLVLWLIGLPYAVLWGLGTAILRFVPYFGVPIAALLPLVLALAVDPGWSMVLWTAVAFFGGEFVIGQVVEPWLYGRHMGLSALAVVISATFWTWLWGPAGLLLSTPMTMCFMVLGRHIKQLQFLEVLLGDRPALAIEEALYLRLLGDDAEEAAAEAEEFLSKNSLCAYYDEVVLKALLLAQADVNRGVLDQNRTAKIRDTVVALIQLLSERDDAEPGAKAAENATNGVAVASKERVVCISGRGPLDEAAALLLIHLFQEAGIPATHMSSDQAASNEDSSTRLVCICFLDPGNMLRARYLVGRIRRKLGGVTPLVAFWRFNAADSDYGEHAKTLGFDIVTRLSEVISRQSSAMAEDG